MLDARQTALRPLLVETIEKVLLTDAVMSLPSEAFCTFMDIQR
jgi:hypothetical protein